MLLSIHQNNFTDSTPFGAQVLYAPTDGSKALAETTQRIMIDTLDPQNRRTVSQISADIYLMNRISCPAVLIECGFLSNPTEAQLLKTKQYQQQMAFAIGCGILEYTAKG